MIVERIHFYIAFVAGAIMTAVNIYLGAGLVAACERLIIILVVFYVAGLLAEGYVRRKIIKKPEPPGDIPAEGDDAFEAEPKLTDDIGFFEDGAQGQELYSEGENDIDYQ